MSDRKDKPVLDEQTFAKLLEAAYVLQEHHGELGLNLELQADQLREQESATQSPSEQSGSTPAEAEADGDYSSTLAQIIETQRLIQVGHLDLANALALVAKRVAQITRSNGAAVAIVEGKVVQYRAASGSSSLPQGSNVAMEKALCFSCFRTGQPFSCPDVNPEFLLDAEECQRRGIQSLIAVPVYHDGGIAGALELFFAETNAFGEHDVHTCQLMAGLITEALTRDSQDARKESQAAERASMLEALEKLKPNLAALLEASTAADATANIDPIAVSTAQSFVCRKCGHELVGEELFCGKCGSPRISDSGPPSMQSKVASMRRRQEANQQTGRTPANGAGHQPLASKHDLRPDHEEDGPASNEDYVPHRAALSEARLQPQQPARSFGEAVAHVEGEGADDLPSPLEAELPIEPHGLEMQAMETGLTKTDGAITWSSAAKAKNFLEELAVARNRSAFGKFWSARRGDIYLAVAIILMASVIRWGIWSSHSVSAGRTGMAANSHRRQIPDADLSVFDKLLISVGLAEAPDAPEYKGNPETQVWVDLHTALYYCPGADLYGKTPKGKVTTQRDAQLDQFEPAYRRACD